MSTDDHSTDSTATLQGPFAAMADDLVRRHARRLNEIATAVANQVDPAEQRRRYLSDAADALRVGDFPPRLVAVLQADRLRDTPALGHARAFAGSDKTLLTLVGGTGSGKTLAAAWVAQELGGGRPGFIRSGRLERAGRYDRELQAWLDSRTMLVIDDLGVEYLDGKGAYLSVLDELVDVAWGRRARLVLTSNLDAKALAERVGERIWSRIADVGVVGGCGATDLRRAR